MTLYADCSECGEEVAVTEHNCSRWLCDLCGRPRDVRRILLSGAGWMNAHRGCADQWENDRAEVALD